MSGGLVGAVRRAASRGGSIDDAASAVADVIRSETGRRWVGLYRVAAGEVVNLGWSGPGPPAHPRFPVERGLTGAAIASRTTVCSNDVGSDPRYLTNQETTGSELIVPVVAGGEVVGTLDVEEAHPNAFAPGDVTMFEELAEALASFYRPPD